MIKIKNHIKVDGKLLQTNKRFDQLKNKQKEYISQELYNQCKEYILEKGKFPLKKEKYVIVDKVYEKIEEKGIWIPYAEVYKYFLSKSGKLQNRFIKENLIERT